MQKFVKHILALIMASLFLVSFTGVRLLIHHCMACDTSAMYVFAEAKSCCEDPTTHNVEHTACAINANEQSSCCSEVITENSCDNCCNNEVVYVKNDYEVSHERQVPRVEPVLVNAEIITYSLFSLHFNVQEENYLFPSTVDPPPRKVARDFVIFSHQLKIC